MGRKSHSDYFFRFNASDYIKEYRRAMRSASVEVKEFLINEAQQNAGSLPFKTNIVPLANGTKTTDQDRASDLVTSIEGKVGNYLESLNILPSSYSKGFDAGKSSIPITVSAMGKNYKRTHIGWYYELGTGEKEAKQFKGYWQTQAVNPLRAGFRSPVVSRPAGIWKDAGGNIRRARGKGGRRSPDFIKAIGEDVDAHFWFSKVLYENEGKIISIFLKHVKKVHPSKYMHVKRKVVLGR